MASQVHWLVRRLHSYNSNTEWWFVRVRYNVRVNAESVQHLAGQLMPYLCWATPQALLQVPTRTNATCLSNSTAPNSNHIHVLRLKHWRLWCLVDLTWRLASDSNFDIQAYWRVWSRGIRIHHSECKHWRFNNRTSPAFSSLISSLKISLWPSSHLHLKSSPDLISSRSLLNLDWPEILYQANPESMWIRQRSDLGWILGAGVKQGLYFPLNARYRLSEFPKFTTFSQFHVQTIYKTNQV